MDEETKRYVLEFNVWPTEILNEIRRGKGLLSGKTHKAYKNRSTVSPMEIITTRRKASNLIWKNTYP